MRSVRVRPLGKRGDLRAVRGDELVVGSGPLLALAGPLQEGGDALVVGGGLRSVRVRPLLALAVPLQEGGDLRAVRGDAFVVGGGLRSVRVRPLGKRGDLRAVRGDALVVGGGPLLALAGPLQEGGDLRAVRGDAFVVGGGLPLQRFHTAFGGLLPEGDVAQDVFDILHIVFDDADFAFQGLRAHRVLLCEAARMQYSACRAVGGRDSRLRGNDGEGRRRGGAARFPLSRE